MFSNFVPRHLPALLFATSMTLGGTVSLINPQSSITSFGLPKRIAVSGPAQSTMQIGMARVSSIGAALLVLYSRQQYEAMDLVFGCLAWAGAVDAYVCWKEGFPLKAVVRAGLAGMVSLWGCLGMTSGM